MGKVIYRDPKESRKNSWVRYLLARIKNNKNNLIAMTGKTGSGKSWTAISIAEDMSKKGKVPFGAENIVFNLKSLMQLINSDTLVKGSVIVFDEPQVTISAREFQSLANRVFNYLITTFRHRNWTLFFCTPYEDLLDKTARKLFHAKFETKGINRNKKVVMLKPKIVEYNAQLGKFYEKFLRVVYKPEGKSKYVSMKLRKWLVPAPSKEIIKIYEEKKLGFTKGLNLDIEARLEEHEIKNAPKVPVKSSEEDDEFKGKGVLSMAQLEIYNCWKRGIFRYVDIAKELQKRASSVRTSALAMRKKGYYIENYEKTGKTLSNASSQTPH